MAFGAKELRRKFARPTARDVVALKHLVRFLVQSPRLVYHFLCEEWDGSMRVCVDTDIAGDLETRRSTSGGMIFCGSHLIRHWSTTQSTIALSSAEAELGGIIRGATQGLGCQSLASDLGLQTPLKIFSDASAAIGICRRRGLGKVRHISVADLWIQERLKSQDFSLEKIPGQSNPADMLTKFIDRPTINRLMPLASLSYEIGRPEKAPELTHCILYPRSFWKSKKN